MKKTLVITAIMLFVLCTTTVFASNAKEALGAMPTASDTVDSMVGNTQTVDNSKEENKNKNNNDIDNEEDNDAVSKIVDLKSREKKTIQDYQKAYGSDAYGVTAYVLSRIQIYSIPFCFLGIAISAIYQYVLGVRKLDTRDKGFTIMISVITVFVIAQVLPLVFAIVVKGWRG